MWGLTDVTKVLLEAGAAEDIQHQYLDPDMKKIIFHHKSF
jgi:hypothetical protein